MIECLLSSPFTGNVFYVRLQNMRMHLKAGHELQLP
jgi:hypothetical protein